VGKSFYLVYTRVHPPFSAHTLPIVVITWAVEPRDIDVFTAVSVHHIGKQLY